LFTPARSATARYVRPRRPRSATTAIAASSIAWRPLPYRTRSPLATMPS
jgi:hypothetical protein